MALVAAGRQRVSAKEVGEASGGGAHAWFLVFKVTAAAGLGRARGVRMRAVGFPGVCPNARSR